MQIKQSLFFFLFLICSAPSGPPRRSQLRLRDSASPSEVDLMSAQPIHPAATLRSVLIISLIIVKVAVR